jgi:endonuclease YncB( thermonuclease family)
MIAVPLGLSIAAAGAVNFDGLEPRGNGVVAAAIDGDTLRLVDGREVRLVGILAVKPWATGDEPLAAQSRAALAELSVGREVTLFQAGRRMDRHGRTLAHVRLVPADGSAGLWLQGAMLARGLARVYSTVDNRALVAEMLLLEREARTAGRGLWSERRYRVRTPEDVGDAMDGFHVVEGQVAAAAVVKGRAYLNFGADYKTDFTLTLDPAARRLFEAAGIGIESFKNARVRARGWIESFNGPMIEVTHPEQIEVLP